jgi:hypothetical protein
MKMLKKFVLWFKAIVWEKDKSKVAELICGVVQLQQINKGAIIDVNEKYKINLDADQLGKIFNNFKDIACDIIKRQI